MARRRISPAARDAATTLGLQIAASRRRRRLTAERVAEQAGISPVTLRRVERGDPSVSLGIAFEVASIVGVPLFNAETPQRLAELRAQAHHELALLPRRVRPIDDDGLDDDF